jgi:uncharacterized protein YcnI
MSMRSSRTVRRSAAVVAATALAVVGIAGPAAAHVIATPDSAEQGSFTKVTFRVPNEEEKADTTKLEVDLPADHPVAAVQPRSLPGWTVKVTTTKLAQPIQSDDGPVTEAVTRIVWSGGKIEPGQFQEFDVSLGPLPSNTDRLMLPTLQTYSDGKVVKWDQDPGDGSNEPENPAPVLHLTPKGAGGGDEHGGTPAATKAAAASAATGSDDTARLLGWLGLATGVIGIVVGGLGLTRSRSRSS